MLIWQIEKQSGSTDSDGQIIDVNPAIETTYGFNREEALGQTTSHGKKQPGGQQESDANSLNERLS